MVEEKMSESKDTVKEEGDNTELAKKGCLGCLGVIVIGVIVMVIIGLFVDTGPDVKISGDTANLTVNLQSLYDLELSAHEVAKNVYEVAKNNEGVKKIVIKVMMDGSGLEDKYGNAAKEDLLMGIRTIEQDLNEIRKYNDDSSYAYNKVNEMYYKILLRGMNHSHLLTD